MQQETIIFNLINQELQRQRRGIELIASENFTSLQVMQASGSVLTNKYAEGYPGKRYYGGCEVIDQIEQIAIDRIKQIFNCDYANVQPHSGAQANAAIMAAILKPNDIILGLDLSMGGHLTHGSPVNFSGKLYQSISYTVNKEDGRINYQELEAIALDKKPKLIICGASAYSREWDYALIRKVADKIGAFVLCDMAHPAGLIAAGILQSPLPHCHFVSSTTHKTLRGPRGGIILMHKDFPNPWGIKTPKGETRMMSQIIDLAVFPGQQGGPLEHTIAAKAIAFAEIQQPQFKTYAQQIITNAKAMETALLKRNYHIVSGGTDNHLLLIDLRNKNISGKQAENLLGEADITTNKNMVPYDDKSPFITSGIRIGTAAITTRGMQAQDMETIIDYIDTLINNHDKPNTIKDVQTNVHKLMQKFPLYPTLT